MILGARQVSPVRAAQRHNSTVAIDVSLAALHVRARNQRRKVVGAGVRVARAATAARIAVTGKLRRVDGGQPNANRTAPNGIAIDYAQPVASEHVSVLKETFRQVGFLPIGLEFRLRDWLGRGWLAGRWVHL